MCTKSNDVKFFCLFIEPKKIQEIAKAEFNKTEIFFYNTTSQLSNNILALIWKFETEYINKQIGHKYILESLSTELVITSIFKKRIGITPSEYIKSIR